jgi:hypothetical protein
MKADGYNDVLCEIYADAHWKFYPHVLNTLQVDTSNVLLQGKIFEVVNGSFVAPGQGVTWTFSSTSFTLRNIALDPRVPLMRFFWVI